MPLRTCLLLALTVTIAFGCTRFPALDARISAQARAADFPRLLPMTQLMAGVSEAQIVDATSADLAARMARLRARAARLRGPVIDPASRARLMAAIRRHI